MCCLYGAGGNNEPYKCTLCTPRGGGPSGPWLQVGLRNICMGDYGRAEARVPTADGRYRLLIGEIAPACLEGCLLLGCLFLQTHHIKQMLGAYLEEMVRHPESFPVTG